MTKTYHPPVNFVQIMNYQAGTKMNFSVAIDFTSSNGFPSEPESLHYRDPAWGGENQYTMAIRAVGDIIQVNMILLNYAV